MEHSSNNYLLEVQNLHLHFFTNEGVVKAVNGATYGIRRGKTLCVVGESGCGKSVTARAILQIVQKPGKIIDGQVIYHRQQDDNNIETINITKLPAAQQSHPSDSWQRNLDDFPRTNDIA